MSSDPMKLTPAMREALTKIRNGGKATRTTLARYGVHPVTVRALVARGLVSEELAGVEPNRYTIWRVVERAAVTETYGRQIVSAPDGPTTVTYEDAPTVRDGESFVIRGRFVEQPDGSVGWVHEGTSIVEPKGSGHVPADVAERQLRAYEGSAIDDLAPGELARARAAVEAAKVRPAGGGLPSLTELQRGVISANRNVEATSNLLDELTAERLDTIRAAVRQGLPPTELVTECGMRPLVLWDLCIVPGGDHELDRIRIAIEHAFPQEFGL